MFSPFTDHLNAVRFLNNALHLPPALHIWSSLPARSLYRWLYNILRSLPTTPALQYACMPIPTIKTWLLVRITPLTFILLAPRPLILTPPSCPCPLSPWIILSSSVMIQVSWSLALGRLLDHYCTIDYDQVLISRALAL